MRNFIKIDKDGLQVPHTTTEIKEALTERLKVIYGLDDTPFESNAPDGQMVDILALIAYDFYNILASRIFNSQFWSTAIGNELDMHAFFKNIKRRGGQFTIQNIEITVDREIKLQGLDENYDNLDTIAYTVQDDAGQQFLLINTITLTAGTHTLQFRAKQYGQVITSPNTLTTPVEVLLGVIDVNNPTSQTSIGRDEETDAEFRARGYISNELLSTNSIEAMESGIINLPNVTDCKIYDNDASITDGNGIPPYSNWAIVDGGDSVAIANEIYKNKGWGGQKGSVSINITKKDGTLKQILFDRPINQNLYIQFNIKRSKPNQNFSINAIRDYIVKNITYKINQVSESSSLITTALKAIEETGGGGYPLDLFISKNNTDWFEYLETDTIQHKFTLSSLNISITVLI
jgi:hypothetical protein